MNGYSEEIHHNLQRHLLFLIIICSEYLLDVKANNSMRVLTFICGLLFMSMFLVTEAGVPAHGRPGVAGMGKPLVAIPNGHSFKGGRKNLGVESVVSKFAGANFAKIIPAGESKMDENGRLSGLGNKFDGVFGSHNSSSAVRGEHPIQSTHNVQGSTDGNCGACSMLVEVRGDGQEHSEEPELEFAEPSKEPTSSY